MDYPKAMTPRARNAALKKVADGYARVATSAHPHCICWDGAGTKIIQAHVGYPLDPTSGAARRLRPGSCYLHRNFPVNVKHGAQVKERDALALDAAWAFWELRHLG